MDLSHEVRGSGRARRAGLAAVVLGSAIGVGSMSGCGAALLGGAAYLAAEEIAQSNVEAARIRARAESSHLQFESNGGARENLYWKGEPSESYSPSTWINLLNAPSGKRLGTLEIHDEGIQFHNDGFSAGGRPEPLILTSIPYREIQKISYWEATTRKEIDALEIQFRFANGALGSYRFELPIETRTQDLANRIFQKCQVKVSAR